MDPNKVPLYRRAAPALLVAVALATAACGSDSPETRAEATSTVQPADPTIDPSLFSAEQQFSDEAVDVATDILDDAANADTQVHQYSPSAFSNANAIYAENGELLNEQLTHIEAAYQRSQGQIEISSEDLYYLPGERVQTDTFAGITLIFSAPPSPNSLDAKLDLGEKLTLEDLQSMLHNSQTELVNAGVIQYRPNYSYLLSTYPPENHYTPYTYSKYVNDPNIPGPAQSDVTEAALSEISDTMRAVEDQLRAGIQ